MTITNTPSSWVTFTNTLGGQVFLSAASVVAITGVTQETINGRLGAFSTEFDRSLWNEAATILTVGGDFGTQELILKDSVDTVASALWIALGIATV